MVLLVAAGCSGTPGSSASGTAATVTWSAPVHIEPTSLAADYDSIYGVSGPTSTAMQNVAVGHDTP